MLTLIRLLERGFEGERERVLERGVRGRGSSGGDVRESEEERERAGGLPLWSGGGVGPGWVPHVREKEVYFNCEFNSFLSRISFSHTIDFKQSALVRQNNLPQK